MSSENEGNENKQNVAETKKEEKPRKELTPQEIQKRKKMLVYPLFFLLFAGAMWLIFAPSGDKEEQQTDGFNSELPLPKDEAIVGINGQLTNRKPCGIKRNRNGAACKTSPLCSRKKKPPIR